MKILILIFALMFIGCGGGDGSGVDKGFLEKYKYTIKTEAQADEYVKNDSFLKINDKKVDFVFNIGGFSDSAFQGMLSIKIDNDSFNLLKMTALAKEKKFEFQYSIISDSGYKENLLNAGSTKSNVGVIHIDVIKTRTLLFQIPKTELKPTADGKESVFVEFNISEKALNVGSASITLNNDEIIINNGDLGKKTYRVLKKMLNDNPNVKTIVLGNLNGSADDEINVETGRMIRLKGLNTKVLANSDIASGAVDLFASGVQRIYTKGAKVRVHSWSGNGKTGAEYPVNDKAHHSQLGYFTAMLPNTGYDFYFFTLNAASFENVHTMSESEIIKYKLATKIIE